YVEVESENPLERNAGVVDLYRSIFTMQQFPLYEAVVKTSSAGKKDGADLRKVYKDWRTYQFSDHYPMWVRLQTDGSEGYLRRYLENDPWPAVAGRVALVAARRTRTPSSRVAGGIRCVAEFGALSG